MQPSRAALLIACVLFLSALNAQAQNTTLAFRLYLPLALHAGSGQPQPTPTQTADPLVMRHEVIQLVNDYRAANGCPTAAESPILMDAAQAWSDYMQAHQLFEHSSVKDSEWYKHHNYFNSLGVEENIATGHTSAQQVFQAWQASPNHNRTLLSCYYANLGYVYDIGVGLNGRLWTLALGERLP